MQLLHVVFTLKASLTETVQLRMYEQAPEIVSLSLFSGLFQRIIEKLSKADSVYSQKV